MSETYVVRPVGYVRSALTDPSDAPMQGTEGAPDAWLEFDPPFGDALRDLAAGSEVIVITWLHLASRHVLRVTVDGTPILDIKPVLRTDFSSR